MMAGGGGINVSRAVKKLGNGFTLYISRRRSNREQFKAILDKTVIDPLSDSTSKGGHAISCC